MTLAQLYEFCQGNIIPLRNASKAPLESAWTVSETPIQTVQDALLYLDMGQNIGYRIPDGVLVIDVDPRNGGAAAFDTLPQAVQKLPRTTDTPSGGWHIYTRLPDGFDAKRLRATHPDYPGIDFLRRGKQVVLPGSSLGSELIYQLHETARLPIPATPESLITLLDRGERPEPVERPSGFLSNSELAQVLDNLPIDKYQDNDSWLQVTMACHHATAGDGLEAFLAWSLSDPAYSDQEESIRSRWESMTVNDDSAQITIRTLLRETTRNGVTPSWLKVKAGITQGSADEMFKKIEDNTASTRTSELLDTIQSVDDRAVLLTSIALQVGTESLINEGIREMLYKEIAKKTGSTLGSIKRDVKELCKNTPSGSTTVGDDERLDSSQTHEILCRTLVNSVSERNEDNPYGVSPMFTRSQWWLWQGNHWVSGSAEAEMRRRAADVIMNHGTMVTAALCKEIVELARIHCHVEEDRLQSDEESIRIYAKNKVLVFDRKTATWRAEDHHYQNCNTHTLPVVYHPDVPAPKQWLAFLDEVMTSETAQRTLACYIAYAASGCRPFLRKFLFVYGPPRSGKSTALDTIEAMLGFDNCSSLNIGQLSNRNGPALLVDKLANISNETKGRKAFDDDMLKALVSGEAVTVEQKFKDPFSHRNTAKFFFAGNGFPKISDESEAVWDRVTLLMFPNSIPEARADHTLHRILQSELSGILKWAMDIFAVEYMIDECRTIMQPDEAGREGMEYWRGVNNPALMWARERLAFVPSGRVPLDAAYADYRQWCRDNGHYETAKNVFSRQVQKTIDSVKDGSNHTLFAGVELKAYGEEKTDDDTI